MKIVLCVVVIMLLVGVKLYVDRKNYKKRMRERLLREWGSPIEDEYSTGKLQAVVTQNIDGLHQAAGSKKVLELHGSVHRNYCQSCGKLFDAEYILKSSGIPTCDECGGSIKPDVVLYEEGLDQQTLEDAVYYISHADMLIIGGTSLAVYPAAGLIDYYRGNKLVLINKSTTPLDNRADLLIQGSIGAVLSEV